MGSFTAKTIVWLDSVTRGRLKSRIAGRIFSLAAALLGVYRRGRKAQDFEQVGKVGVRNALCGVVVLGGVTGACNIQ